MVVCIGGLTMLYSLVFCVFATNWVLIGQCSRGTGCDQQLGAVV